MMIKTMRHLTRYKRFARRQDGMAYLEFALTAPVLILFLLGAVEVTRYVLICQKLEKTAMTVSDLVSQETTAVTTVLDNDLLASQQIMLPYTFNTNGYVIISSVTQTGKLTSSNQPVVSWQYSGGGTMTMTSAIGHTGGKATLPTGFTLNDKDNVIITEVFYQFKPMLGTQVLSATNLYRMSVFRPRLGALTTLVGG